MKKFLKTSFIVFLVAFLSIYSISLFFDNTADREKITDVQVSNTDKQLIEDVYLSAPLSCKSVMKILDIKPLPLKNIVYFPTCYDTDTGVRIVYIQTIKA